MLLWEQGEGLDVDTATVTIGPPEGAWSITGGHLVVPFGVYETNLISDPLTLDIGETKQTAFQFDGSAGGLSGSVFVFKGDNGDNVIEGFGVAAGYSVETESFELGLNLSYTNDLGDSDGLEVEGGEGYDRVAGISASAALTVGSITVLGEYLGAMDTFGRGLYRVRRLRRETLGLDGGGGLRVRAGRQGSDAGRQLPDDG